MKKTKGYMSVEAALVFPVVIMVVIMMMSMSFYVYDKCVIRTCIYDSLLLGASEEPDGNLDRERLMQERLEKTINENGISLKDVSIETNAGLLKVEACVDAKVCLLWLTSTELPIHQEMDLSKIDVIKSMRLIKHGKNALGKG